MSNEGTTLSINNIDESGENMEETIKKKEDNYKIALLSITFLLLTVLITSAFTIGLVHLFHHKRLYLYGKSDDYIDNNFLTYLSSDKYKYLCTTSSCEKQKKYYTREDNGKKMDGQISVSYRAFIGFYTTISFLLVTIIMFILYGLFISKYIIPSKNIIDIKYKGIIYFSLILVPFILSYALAFPFIQPYILQYKRDKFPKDHKENNVGNSKFPIT